MTVKQKIIRTSCCISLYIVHSKFGRYCELIQYNAFMLLHLAVNPPIRKFNQNTFQIKQNHVNF